MIERKYWAEGQYFRSIIQRNYHLSKEPGGMGDEYLRTIYSEANPVYAPFTSRRLY